MAENETGSEHETKKTVVVEHRTSDTSKSMIIPLVIVGVIVLVLLIFIFLRIS